LNSGEADIITPGPYQVADFNNPNVKLETGDSTLSTSAFIFNFTHWHFNDVHVREAFI
jgi:ABC-type transport system substrate-binding protein